MEKYNIKHLDPRRWEYDKYSLSMCLLCLHFNKFRCREDKKYGPYRCKKYKLGIPRRVIAYNFNRRYCKYYKEYVDQNIHFKTDPELSAILSKWLGESE